LIRNAGNATSGGNHTPDRAARQQEILRLAECQLFFVGGAPRSGTTWLELLLASHPEVYGRGEGLFLKHLAESRSTAW
jgi:Sulfotransferase family